MRHFAKYDYLEKELAFFVLEKIQRFGGIFEHPAGSSFFKIAGIKPTISVNQSWFGFPGTKKTYLYFVDCKPLAFPLSFDLPKYRSIHLMPQKRRSDTTPAFASWLIDCILHSKS